MSTMSMAWKRTAPALALAGALGWGTGCMVTAEERTRQQAQQLEDQRMAEEDQRRMTGRIETLELALERMETDQARWRSEAAAEMDLLRRQMREMNGQQEERWRALEAARSRDRQEIIDTISSRMSEFMRTQRAAPAARTRAPGSGYGYEHEVRPGETLSQIASAYGVSLQAVIEANRIDDPNRVRAGQKLFIPE